MTYRYETHLHTYPVSKCGKKTVEENLLFYQKLNFRGVFITNHFIDGNINMGKTLPTRDLLEFYFSDYEEAKKIGANIGLDVFFGVEMTYQRTDFLVYGLDPEWYLAHGEIRYAEKHELLPYLQAQGALVIHAHPFREGRGIHTLRLYPRSVHGVEIYNGHPGHDSRNDIAELWAKKFNLLTSSGTDYHHPHHLPVGGIATEFAITSNEELVKVIREGNFRFIRGGEICD